MSLTVLVVEDDLAIQDLVRLTLEGAGYRVETARDGAEAIECLERHRPDLIVLDLMLPGMNGFQLAEQLAARGLRPAVPVLVLSAARQVLFKAHWIEADACLEKPFAIPRLLAEVDRLTRRPAPGLAAPASSRVAWPA